jgi:hypothetical protein
MPCDTFHPETSSDSPALWHVVYQLPMHMTTFSERFRLPLPSCGMTSRGSNSFKHVFNLNNLLKGPVTPAC